MLRIPIDCRIILAVIEVTPGHAPRSPLAAGRITLVHRLIRTTDIPYPAGATRAPTRGRADQKLTVLMAEFRPRSRRCGHGRSGWPGWPRSRWRSPIDRGR